jgi:hypothetical protein
VSHKPCFLILTVGGSRLGRGQVKVDRRRTDKAESPGSRVRYLSYSPSRVISGGIVHGMARTVTDFHRPSRDRQ